MRVRALMSCPTVTCEIGVVLGGAGQFVGDEHVRVGPVLLGQVPVEEEDPLHLLRVVGHRQSVVIGVVDDRRLRRRGDGRGYGERPRKVR